MDDDAEPLLDQALKMIGELEMARMRLQLENERLRAALEELATLGEQGMKPNYGEWLTFHDKVAKVAREALCQQQMPSEGK